MDKSDMIAAWCALEGFAAQLKLSEPRPTRLGGNPGPLRAGPLRHSSRFDESKTRRVSEASGQVLGIPHIVGAPGFKPGTYRV
ncbi:MAG: hypothetical protein UY96_C0030G0001 [Parcubacteria group bacterium GW2011_GWB1_56_8]|nr:MAG: hypothetical protein UY96_C0030G0001 [Parcubacteria group bacterium GW2011_GWB1_56_8]